MKSAQRVRRQIFVLTLEEKKAVCCIIAALVLGLATKHYRDTHPQPPRPPSAKEQRDAGIAARQVNARAKSARGASAQPKPPTMAVQED